MSKGFLGCDEKMPIRLKGVFYETAKWYDSDRVIRQNTSVVEMVMEWNEWSY